MKSSNYRTTIFSSIAGVVFALVVFISFGYSQTAVAGDWCPNPPAGCASAGCFTNGAGQKSCKYFAQVNGAECHVGGACSSGYGGSEGGGGGGGYEEIEIINP